MSINKTSSFIMIIQPGAKYLSYEYTLVEVLKTHGHVICSVNFVSRTWY